MKVKVKFGMKHNGFFFPNAAVFKFEMTTKNFNKLKELIEQVKMVIPEKYQEMIVCETYT